MSDEAGEPGVDAPVDLEALAKRIDRLYFLRHTSSDQLLDQVVLMGRLGAPTGIGMIVDGKIILGAVTSLRTFAGELSAATREALVAYGWDEADVERVSTSFDLLVADLEDRARRDEEVAERHASATIDEVPLADIGGLLDFVRGQSVIDLHSVQITDGPNVMHIRAIRVERKSVSAWWPLRAQGIQVAYTSSGEVPDVVDT